MNWGVHLSISYFHHAKFQILLNNNFIVNYYIAAIAQYSRFHIGLGMGRPTSDLV